MSWASLSLVTDAEIGALEPEATATAAPWGAVTWASARAEAKRDLKIWIEAAYPDVAGVADYVRDLWAADYCFGYTAAAYRDYTNEAANRTEADLPMGTIIATPATDRIYLGSAWIPDAIEVQLTPNALTNGALTASYWGPTGWTSLSATDGTVVAGKSVSQSGRVTWTAPAQWDMKALNGTAETYYWTQLQWTAMGAVAVHQLLLVRAPDSLKRIAAYLSLYHIYNGLAPQSANPDSWLGRAEKYWGRAVELFATLRDKQGIPIDLDLSDTTSIGEQATVRQYGRMVLGRG